MRFIPSLVGAAAAIVTLTGCTGDGPDTTTTDATGSPAQQPTTEPEPEVFRESIGLFRTTDPATADLVAVLDTGDVALDLTLHVTDEVVETTEPVNGPAGSVNLWFFFDEGEDNFLTLNIPEAALTIGDIEKQDGLSTLRGTFSVEPSSGSDVDYVLTQTGDVPEATTTDEVKCGEEEAFIADAETLAGDPAAYATIREHWVDSPRMWWAVKATAHSIAEYGDFSDSMAVACAIYVP
ncbi:hypothetical protein LX16_2182 [Stackebrandtia albiflava]|uniref:Lipoprotein n=1 Tax=Stackebrandtia albiflava TaxID=406432 RepID=A0A562V0K0_9ACTN|nr:hypothetical protein [Stackebrandtia albiflava]TWJ11460.1 hypothetical protein LX16_2182 [Stackebrandtia albiflava]